MNRHALLAIAIAIALSSIAHAVPPRRIRPSPVHPVSPVMFSAEPVRGTHRWRWSLTNVSNSPVTVAADRRLIWLEASPPLALPHARHRARATSSVCVREDHPTTNDLVRRVTLAHGERYAELVDLRDLCRLHVPVTATPRTIVSLHYGFDTAVVHRHTAARPMPTRSIVFAEDGAVVDDLTARVAVPDPTLPESPAAAVDPRPSPAPAISAAPAPAPVTATATAPAPATAVPPSDSVAPGPRLVVANAEAATGDRLQVSVRLNNPSVQPLWAVWRPGLLDFTVHDPLGRTWACTGLTRHSHPPREVWRRIPPHGSVAMTVQPGFWCPRTAFAPEGIYRVQATYANTTDGRDYGFPRVLTGQVVSDSFDLRVVRGSGQYVPLDSSVSMTGQTAGTGTP